MNWGIHANMYQFHELRQTSKHLSVSCISFMKCGRDQRTANKTAFAGCRQTELTVLISFLFSSVFFMDARKRQNKSRKYLASYRSFLAPNSSFLSPYPSKMKNQVPSNSSLTKAIFLTVALQLRAFLPQGATSAQVQTSRERVFLFFPCVPRGGCYSAASMKDVPSRSEL